MAIQELVSTEVSSVPGEFNDLMIWVEDIVRSHYEDLKRLQEGLHSTSNVTESPYTILPSDQQIFVDTDSGDVTVNLPVGIDGKWYRIINVGSSGNDVTVVPNGTELLTGENSSRTLSDRSVIILAYSPTEGWW